MFNTRFIAQSSDRNSDYSYAETDPTGRYVRFEEVLGKGAMKTVYKGIDEILGMEVAWSQVKLCGSLQSPEDLQRLYSEVHLLSTLNHVSIMRFYTSWIDIDQGTFNFITEMFTSGTLREYRRKYKRVDIRAIKIWAFQILEGLIYLHGHDPPIIHRDLKCDNILVNGHLGQVKIGDLGLAAILRGSHRAHSIIGTPEFMAPELYEENYNELVDVYSFGMCVLELLTSEYPYSECTNPAQIYKKVTSGKRPKAFYKVQDLEAQRFIGKCLETPSKRLSAKELLLDPFLSIDDDGESAMYIHHQKQFFNDHLGIEELLLDEDPPRTNMSITGKLNPEDDTIFLKVQTADNQGSVRNIFFPFDVVCDTPFGVATEMVKELEITDWEPYEISDMIDKEISALVPLWKEWNHSQLAHSYILEDDDGFHRPFYSSPSCSSSLASLSGLLTSHKTDKRSHICHSFQDDLYDDTSTRSSLHLEKYSKLNYYYGDEHEPDIRPKRQNQHTAPSTRNSTRFCPEENSSVGKSIARNCSKEHKVLFSSQEASSSKFEGVMDSRKLTKNRSLVDMPSQLLHRSLVEEINKRRLFKTVGTLENIGFQEPSKGSSMKSRPTSDDARGRDIEEKE